MRAFLLAFSRLFAVVFIIVSEVGSREVLHITSTEASDLIAPTVPAGAVSDASPSMADPENSLDEWVPPEEFKKGFPYYVSGFDYDNRPVIVGETGKWDYEQVIAKGPDEVETLHKYFDQMYSRMEQWAITNPLEELGLLLDYNLYHLPQGDSKESLKLQLALFRNLYKKRDRIAYAIIVNANFKAQTTLNFARPFLGDLSERLEIHGTNPVKWIPHVLRKIPRDQLSPVYGGTKEFKPVWSNITGNNSHS